MEVKIRCLPHHAGVPLPARQTTESAGYDLCSAAEDFTLAPGERRLVPTGLEMELPPGVELQIRPRSGLALRHGLVLPNAPGTIDPDYRGEVQVIVWNLGGDPVVVRRGDRIAQGVFARFEAPDLRVVDALGETARGAGGFGSTGVAGRPGA